MPTNQNQSVRRYEKQYRDMLETVFGVTAAFQGTLAPIQILDGVQENATAFSVKTNGTPVVIGEYSTDANSGGFGDATGNSRFGKMTEIKYENTDVPYSYTLAMHKLAQSTSVLVSSCLIMQAKQKLLQTRKKKHCGLLLTKLKRITRTMKLSLL